VALQLRCKPLLTAQGLWQVFCGTEVLEPLYASSA
jgi:hypothetical protein